MNEKKRIGIVGGGQLGRMLALDAQKLGHHVTTLDVGTDGPAAQVSDAHINAPFTDAAAIQTLADLVDVMTFEIESANAEALKAIASVRPHAVHPSPETLALIKDKYAQKEFLKSHGVPVAEAVAVHSKEDVERAGEVFGYPLILKSRFGAYDGRGNATIKTKKDIEQGMQKLGGAKLYVEQFVPFIKELAVVAARSTTGECKNYPVVETVHENHICHTVTMPAPVSEEIRAKAETIALQVLDALGGAGVFGIELFLTKDGAVILNEVAPRVHNSGHITMDATETPQFEQHIRAITGMPLGSVAMKAPVGVMINILGDTEQEAAPTGVQEAEELGGVRVHLYGKKQTKKARKMGHINVIGEDSAATYAKAKKARKRVTI